MPAFAHASSVTPPTPGPRLAHASSVTPPAASAMRVPRSVTSGAARSASVDMDTFASRQAETRHGTDGAVARR